ncbi:MAG: carboxypeptidase-like regulatory domain-containing protein, partial [Phycisphaerae bacterium]|nr:carboxypeptidase-like regulatory domain-containing protein [Saprospiraceae bacterium]
MKNTTAPPSLKLRRVNLLLVLLLLPFLSSAQVSGKITGEGGEPLPYATVYVRNTSNGTVSNAEGNYRLSVGKGPQEIVFQYIGYKQRIEKITVGDKPARLDVRLESSNLELQEMVVSSIDPAVRIMREVIAKRRYYKKKVSNYACDVYIKGFYKLSDAPKKIMGQDVGNMGGALDSTGAGVIYLSESVSKLWVQDPPGRKKEVMVSSRVSGSENGFSLNRATLTEFNLYDERLEIFREILSPLADNAFNYYNFKHAGRFKNELGFTVEKIKVIPKRSADPTFSGFLYIIDELWLLAGADLALTGPSIKQPILDTMRIQQQYVPLGANDTWGLLTQVTSFKFGILGFKISGFFNSIFSNYDLDPKFEADLFNKEIFKIA